ncbi:hypothetical protein OC835_002386 [Tilletia horrida]|nr:hypothetical protein OC835_002386 [Tilletia horrida]KAK0554159.1 hypothetical protein OC844_006208 [Tilletia horrida]
MAMFNGLSTQVDNLSNQLGEATNLLKSLVSGQNPRASSSSAGIPADDVLAPRSGPAAPPPRRRHDNKRLQYEFRRLIRIKMGDPNKHPSDYAFPTSGNWPTRTIPGSDGQPSRTVKLLRLDWTKSYQTRQIQEQFRPIYDILLRRRADYGVPRTWTRDKLIRSLSTSYEYLRRTRRLKVTEGGPAKLERERLRSDMHAAKRAKRTQRHEALCIKHTARFANGDAVPIIPQTDQQIIERRFERRADIEFADQAMIHSPEITETEKLPNGLDRKVTRPLFVGWRSKQLVELLYELDEMLTRNRPYPSRPCRQAFALGAGFRLPSSIRRWMVSSEWMEANPEACANVSDNAGPFDRGECDFVVASGPKDWGDPVPEHLRPSTDEDANVPGFDSEDDELDYFSQRHGGGSSSSSSESSVSVSSEEDDEEEDEDDEDNESDMY